LLTAGWIDQVQGVPVVLVTAEQDRVAVRRSPRRHLGAHPQVELARLASPVGRDDGHLARRHADAPVRHEVDRLRGHEQLLVVR